MNQTEIERKWLMEGFPDLPCQEELLQVQGYLSFAPVTVRIRRTQRGAVENFCLTIKGRGGLARTEVELPMQKEQYEALMGLVQGATATKRMRLCSLPDGYVAECSLVDEGEPGSFSYAEVEFESEEEAMAFVPPACFGREVTEEPGHTMAAYCQRKSQKVPDSL